MKFPVPWSNAVVLKKYATLETLALKPVGSTVGGEAGKKSRVVLTIATVGPAARKLHMRIARQTRTAMDFLYHFGLGPSVLQGTGRVWAACQSDSPVQRVIRVVGWCGDQNDLVGLVMAKTNIAKGSLPYVFGLWIFVVIGS